MLLFKKKRETFFFSIILSYSKIKFVYVVVPSIVAETGFFCDIVRKIDHMNCKCTSNTKHGKQPASFQHLGISHLSPTSLGN